MKIEYLEPAKLDLQRVHEYLLVQGLSNKAADIFVASIVNDIRRLSSHPNLGFSLGEMLNFSTEYRALLVSKERYLVVYEIASSCIDIRRIYSTKENYIKDLLP